MKTAIATREDKPMAEYIDGHPFNDRLNYCPNCGANMDGAE
nr:MAG TPA: 30S ribosomal protein S27 [Caudoviricetes sp.]